MNSALRSALELNFPDGRGVHFPPPVMALDDYMRWLQEQHEERVRQGTVDRHLTDPLHCPVDAPFRLD